MNKSTTEFGREFEEDIVKTFGWANARRSKSSGASFHDPIDVTSDVMVTECEATEKQSYSLKLSFWEEVYQKQHSGKIPSLAIRFHKENGRNVDLMVIEAGQLSSLFEEVEALRTIAVQRD